MELTSQRKPLVLVLMLFLLAGARLAYAALPLAVPAPGDWIQWQPETDQSDTRLAEQTASIWLQEITIAELLATLSEQTGLELSATKHVSSWHISSFVKNRPAASLMLALAAIVQGYWVYPADSIPESRVYVLVPHDDLRQPLDVYKARRSDIRVRKRNAWLRPIRAQRLNTYFEALELSPEELLNRYEKTDPWLCADLLNPRNRPLLKYLADLDNEQQEKLFLEGSVVLRMTSLPAVIQDHLRRLNEGEFEGPGIRAISLRDSDWQPRFNTEEERWANGVVKLSWSDLMFRWSVSIPDSSQSYFGADLIWWGPAIPPMLPRQLLTRLGYREDSLEYHESAEKESREWDKDHPFERGLESWTEGQPEPLAVVRANDQRLQQKISLENLLSPSGSFSLVPLLESAARQTGIAIIASCLLPYNVFRVATSEMPSHTKFAFNQLLASDGEQLGWSFIGDNLVVIDSDQRINEESRVSEEVIVACEALLSKKDTVSLEDLLNFLQGVNEEQLVALSLRFYELDPDGCLFTIYPYSQFSPQQRVTMASSEGLSYGILSAQPRRWVLRQAQKLRPWINETDLSNTKLRTTISKTSMGSNKLSFVIEYHFPDAPNDCDIILICPLNGVS